MNARRIALATIAAGAALLIGTALPAATTTVDGPPREEKTIRIVLQWGPTPADLDAHLTGPAAEAGRRFHLSYFDPRRTAGATDARLDADEDEGYGPETVVLTNPGQGAYRYSVHDFGNRESLDAEALANSGASVEVYRGDALLATFYPRVNVPGTLWTVFELRNGEVVPVDAMTFESDPTGVE